MTSYSINKTPKRSDEPIWWGLFAIGGTWFAIVTPVTILVLGVLVPLGIFDAQALSYMRVTEFAQSFIGAMFIIATISLPMWHAMHRLHHGMHDLRYHSGLAGKVACYMFAGIISALSLVCVLII
ncbi:fumarate reductase subunit FrdD [Vibrio ostreicida]|uniref:Fumarate reductase subunit D n=1 Tax=Vibrio ostreicida TaxID=526588 RepID=A0ABT8BMT1_9VIBR|nr:fumarate reductase subunit FrdD [Vibrio ostreicida]MDN3608441.1 fumarate reductase subunit FrdD [Vibrio ostreicida]NPD10262.1 fumarate reductase subunit FrdD [Vibrio ostreicida]